jgi:hypothetical protein
MNRLLSLLVEIATNVSLHLGLPKGETRSTKFLCAPAGVRWTALVVVAAYLTLNSEKNAAGVPIVYSADASLILEAPNAIALDRSGWDLAVDGNSIMVGTPGIGGGKLTQFERTTGSYVRDILENDVQSGYFGQDIDIDDGRTIAGCWYCNSAYIFDVSTGNRLQKLSAPSSVLLGWSVAIKNNLALVGDVGDNVRGPQAGAAFIFDATSGSVLHSLRPSDLQSYDSFGKASAIDGNYALVTGRSYVYQFHLNSGGLIRKLRGTDSTNGFGANIAVDNNRMIVSDSNKPAAYVIDLNTGAQIQKLQVPGVTTLDLFGNSVDISGDLALVGAHDTNIGSVGDAGVAYLFQISTGELLAKFQLSQPEFNNGFGFAVKLEGTTAFISAVGIDDYRGAVYVFEIPEPSALTLLAAGAISLFARRKR